MIFPSPASAALAGAGAPLALMIGVFAPSFWPIGLLWIFMTGLLVAADAVLAADRRGMKLQLTADRQAFIGNPADVSAEVIFGGRSRPPKRIDMQFEVNEFLKPRFRAYRHRTELQAADGSTKPTKAALDEQHWPGRIQDDQ